MLYEVITEQHESVEEGYVIGQPGIIERRTIFPAVRFHPARAVVHVELVREAALGRWRLGWLARRGAVAGHRQKADKDGKQEHGP